MKAALVLISLVLAVVSAVPLDFGEVKKAPAQNGITLEKQPVLGGFMVKDIGDIWSDCGSSSDIGKIGTVTITPDPPQKGADLTVDAEVDLSEEVSGGSLKVKLQYTVFGVPITVIDQTYDLCGEETGLSCPLAAGTQNVKLSEEIPSSAPGGKYTGNAVATSSDGKQIVCINLEFNL